MTRHGEVQPSATGTQPPATNPRASIVIIGADRAVLGLKASRRYRSAGRRGGPFASIPALLNGGRAIPKTSRNQKSP